MELAYQSVRLSYHRGREQKDCSNVTGPPASVQIEMHE